jgi:hypothetical protein
MKYWLISPFERHLSCFEEIWDFDLKNNWITIGWQCLGNVSQMTEEQIRERAEQLQNTGRLVPKNDPK